MLGGAEAPPDYECISEELAPRLIYDPGVMSDVLHAACGESRTQPSIVHCSGVAYCDAMQVPLSKVLFDSGAINSSYIGRHLIQRYSDALGNKLISVNTNVRLADNTTVVPVKQALTLNVEFVDTNAVLHRGIVTFGVLEMPGLDAIIGLPDIVGSFLGYFIDLLQTGSAQSANMLSLDLSLSGDSLPRPTWTNVPDDLESPEEKETPDPCSFTAYLYYLGRPYEEVLQDYVDMIEKHVNPEFLAAVPELKAYLMTEKVLSVFVPTEWKGLAGFEPVELQWKEDSLPERLRPKTRPINPRLYEAAEKEFKRLMQYMYQWSTSPIASSLTIAAKATPPYLRFCGDYRFINTKIDIPVYYIPHVQHSIEKARTFSVFLDLDMSNSFHQIPLGPITAARLAVQTPWGLVQPRFLPEGVGPASGLLQLRVSEIFKEFEAWTIVIFDNFLILAHDYKDAYEKFQKVIDRCAHHHVVLKFSKSWLGFDEAQFFGYLVSKGQYKLSQARKEAIEAIPFPYNLKAMQRFLGAALFFKSFVPHYSMLAAPLNDMTKATFSWDRSTWSRDYEGIFNAFKAALQEACTLHFPDYSLEWILRTDASELAVGAVLFQVAVQPDGSKHPQLIACSSKKFSDTALKWDMFKKEAYGLYFGCRSFEYYLRGKPFVLETDHRNLLWIEAAEAPIIVRWRIFMQSLVSTLRDIPGKLNTADMWTRMYPPDDLSSPPASAAHALLFFLVAVAAPTDAAAAAALFSILPSGDVSTLPAEEDGEETEVLPASGRLPLHPPEYYLRQVHGGRSLHYGVRHTWNTLNKVFPGHSIPYRLVAEFVSSCPVCQKFRLAMMDNIEPVYRHLKPDHHRRRVGVDRVTITPADENGNDNAVVVVDHFSKHAQVYAATDYTAQTLATALFQYYTTFGVFHELYSDPGSDMLSDVVKQLNAWLGVEHRVSLVDRHESNGVEGTNKQLLRHLTVLVNEERLKHRWSDPSVLCLINFALNDAVNSETGMRPFDLKFGSDDAKYFTLPATLSPERAAHTYLQQLDENLRVVRAASKKFQDRLVAERTKSNSDKRNTYQPGDYVLRQPTPGQPKPNKLSPLFLGPYEVIQQRYNSVQCRHLATGLISDFHVTTLKIFHGDYQTAYDLALRDSDQFVIDKILGYKGDPMVRTSMSFLVRFADGDVVWRTWDRDLFQSIPYENFCRAHPPLFPLLSTVTVALKEIQAINKQDITSVSPSDKVFVDLRRYGAVFYEQLDLPDSHLLTYVVVYEYTSWSSPRNHRHINAFCPIFDEHWPRLDSYFVFAYGACKVFDPTAMVLVDESFVLQHPAVLPPAHADRLLRKYRARTRAI